MDPVASPPSPPSGIGMFLPMIIIWLPFVIVLAFVAKRKGFHPALAILIGIFPVANVIFAFYMASKTDISVLQRLSALEETRNGGA